jgi:AmiR/NasT family two-component response regulator
MTQPPSLSERTIQLQMALDSRVILDRAKGILAERESLSTEDALGKVRRQARSERRKLHDVAAEIVSTLGSSKAAT